jgi:N-acetylglucosamine kinase
MAERVVMGVDGGNTSCRVVLADGGGQVLGYGKSGPASADGVDMETAARHIREAVDSAWHNAGRMPQMVDASFWGLAGVVSGRDRDLIREIVVSLRVSVPKFIGIDHDIRIALSGGLGNLPGVALIVGTGCSCYGRTKSGDSIRVGGWGHLLDDGGSSYFLGLEALKAVVRAADGRSGETSLTNMVLDHFGIQDVQDIMNQVYANGTGKVDIAALAPLVLAEAQAGDASAKAIVSAAYVELTTLVKVAFEKLKFEDNVKRLTVTGGLAHSGGFFKNGLYHAIQAQVADVQIHEPILPPVLGAVLLALAMIDRRPSADFIPALLQGGQNIK